MDQRDSVVVGHFSLDLDVFIFILLRDLNKLLSMFNPLTRFYFHI